MSLALALALALGGCASVDATRAVLTMLKVANPVHGLIAALFLEPMIAALQERFAAYAPKVREKLPANVVAAIDFAVQTKGRIDALQKEADALKQALAAPRAGRDELERRVLGLRQLAKPPAELAALSRELDERNRELRARSDALDARTRELELLRSRYAAERRALQEKLGASEEARNALAAKNAELLAALNAAPDVARSPVRFVDGGAWNEQAGYVSGVQVKEREFDRVDWANFALEGKSSWDERIKPVEVALQQKTLIDAELLAKPGEEFARLKDEIRQGIKTEGDKFEFRIRRKAN